MLQKIIILTFSYISLAVFAHAPIVDYSTSVQHEVRTSTEAVTPAPSNLNLQQRVDKMEQQINNINEQNLLSKIDELQQRLQKLNGQVEDQSHQIEKLQGQLRSLYQDSEQRSSKAKKLESDTATPVITTGAVVKALPAVNKKNDGKGEKVLLKEQQLYREAINLLPIKKYEASGNKLRSYLKLYPRGTYAAKAHYWLGEINFLQKNYDAAEEEFKTVIDKYPKDERVPDAMFKLALVHQNQGRDNQAKQELQLIIKNYPNNAAAQLAKLQLEGN